VQVTAISIAHGWIEEIRVHDVLREWCIEDAKNDGFLDVVDRISDMFVFSLSLLCLIIPAFVFVST
jgi:hypothetical protein